MTLIFKVNRRGHVIFLSIFHPKINFVSCLQPEIWKVMRQRSLTLIFKVNHWGQVTDFGFSEILDIADVRIDIKSASCIQPELRKVIQWMCVTLNSKINRQGQVIVFNICYILDLENVRIDTKINFVSCLQPETWKVTQKGVWPWFSRSCNKDRIFFHYHRWIPWPRKHTHGNISKKSYGEAKIKGVVPTPLSVFGWRNTLGVWVLMFIRQRLNDIFFENGRDLAFLVEIFRCKRIFR